MRDVPEPEPAPRSIDAVGQILSNYQAALHLFEEAVAGDFGQRVPPRRAPEVLRRAAREVFAPVLEACAGVAPGLDDLVSESIGSAGDVPAASELALRDLVIAERQRVAVTHSRLIRRRPRLIQAAGESAAVAAAARRLEHLETGSHSAGALFAVLLERWG